MQIFTVKRSNLGIYNPKAEMTIPFDASQISIGFILLQNVNVNSHLQGYWNQTMLFTRNPIEQMPSSPTKENLLPL